MKVIPELNFLSIHLYSGWGHSMSLKNIMSKTLLHLKAIFFCFLPDTLHISLFHTRIKQSTVSKRENKIILSVHLVNSDFVTITAQTQLRKEFVRQSFLCLTGQRKKQPDQFCNFFFLPLPGPILSWINCSPFSTESCAQGQNEVSSE